MDTSSNKKSDQGRLSRERNASTQRRGYLTSAAHNQAPLDSKSKILSSQRTAGDASLILSTTSQQTLQLAHGTGGTTAAHLDSATQERPKPAGPGGTNSAVTSK